MKKFIYFKTMLLAVILLVGSANVWGQTTYYWPGSGTWDAANAWATASGGFATTTWETGSIAQFDVAGTITGPTIDGVEVYNIYVNQNISVIAGGKTIGTPAANKIATITVASGKLFDFGSQSISEANGTGFIKSGEGSLKFGKSGGGTYSGGFTLTAGKIILGGAANSLGSGNLTINGGILSASATHIFSDTKLKTITIGGDFSFGDATNVSNISFGTSSSTTITMSLGTGTTRTITIAGTGTYTIWPVISGSGSSLVVNATAAGTLVLSGANTYDGGTTLTGGTLQLGGAGVLADAAPITLNGGTLKTGATTGFSETVGTLNLSNSSTIALGTGVHSLSFTASNGLSWSGTTLTVTGWTGSAGTSGTAGKIFVGTDETGLTASQLAKISFTGYSNGAQILNTGEIVPLLPPSITYTWQGAGGGDWTIATNWSPTRTIPASTDILQFTDETTKTVTNVPIQTIGGLLVSNDTKITLNSSGNAVTLTINDGISGYDLNVASGCELNIAQISTNSALIIALSTGATGSISGSMDFSSATSTTPNQITAADASGLKFNSGAVFTQNTNSTGNVFGSSSTGRVIFLSGSTFIQAAGSNPYAGIVTTFQTGSLYKFTSSGAPSFTGRTYANFEYASGSNQNATGSSAVTMDNLTITNGTLNFNMTGTPGHAIKGNINVVSGATLNFAPTPDAGTVNLNGSSLQTISGAGTITTGANSTLVVDNASGVSLSGNLTITSGTLTVNAGKQLTISGMLTNNGTLNLLSTAADGTATLLIPGTVGGSGTANVNQYLTYRTWYMSSPVSSATPANMDVIKYFNETVAGNVWPPATTMTAGTGYFVTPNNSTYNNNILFSGTLNAGSIPITLTRSTANTEKPGFNLIGNPYPSYLDWTAVCAYTTDAGATHPNQDIMPTTTMWYRTKATGSWGFVTVNGSGVTSPSGVATKYIPPMQAFWVRAKTTGGGTLQLTNSMCSHAGTVDNPSPNALKAPAVKNTELLQLIRLQVNNGINTDEAVIYFSDNAANGFDIYDAPKMSNADATIPEIYTLLNEEQIVINAMNSIPLDTKIGLGFVPGNATSFNIMANEISNLPSDVKVILKDNVTLTETDLTNGVNTYEFSPATTSGDRFSVIFRSPGAITGIPTAANDPNLLVYRNANNQIAVQIIGQLNDSYSLDVYNSVGQRLASKQTTAGITIMDAPQSGVYFVTIKGNGNNTTKKVVIN